MFRSITWHVGKWRGDASAYQPWVLRKILDMTNRHPRTPGPPIFLRALSAQNSTLTSTFDTHPAPVARNQLCHCCWPSFPASPISAHHPGPCSIYENPSGPGNPKEIVPWISKQKKHQKNKPKNSELELLKKRILHIQDPWILESKLSLAFSASSDAKPRRFGNVRVQGLRLPKFRNGLTGHGETGLGKKSIRKKYEILGVSLHSICFLQSNSYCNCIFSKAYI